MKTNLFKTIIKAQKKFIYTSGADGFIQVTN